MEVGVIARGRGRKVATRAARCTIALVAISICAGSSFLVQGALSAFPGTNGVIAFETNRDGQSEIYVMRPDGSAQTRLTTGGGSHPAWSPDGTRIAFTSPVGIVVMKADGSGKTPPLSSPVAGGSIPAFPSWSPDGSKISFARRSGT